MGSNGQDIVSFALKMGFQIHPDVFTLLVKLESERRVEIVSSIIERKKKEQDLGHKLDPENKEHNEIIGNILFTSKIYSKTASKELLKQLNLKREDLKKAIHFIEMIMERDYPNV